MSLMLLAILVRSWQATMIWWFMMTLFKRSFSDYKVGIIVGSFIMSLIITLLYERLFHFNGLELFAGEALLAMTGHRLIVKERWTVSIIEGMVGYGSYILLVINIYGIADLLGIISVGDSTGGMFEAVIVQNVVATIIMWLIQVILKTGNYGYYLLNNNVFPNNLYKMGYVFFFFTCDSILAIEIEAVERPNLIDYRDYWLLMMGVGVAFFIFLWRMNRDAWDSHYKKISVSKFNKFQKVNVKRKA